MLVPDFSRWRDLDAEAVDAAGLGIALAMLLAEEGCAGQRRRPLNVAGVEAGGARGEEKFLRRGCFDVVDVDRVSQEARGLDLCSAV